MHAPHHVTKEWIAKHKGFTLVIFVTLDLNQPARGFTRVNKDSLERLIQSMAKV
jgi:hypothetical protein